MSTHILEVLETDALFHRDNALQRGAQIIDDFEHDDEQTLYRTVATTGSWTTNTTAKRPNSNGSKGLDMDGQRTIWSCPGDGLPSYPSPGDTFVYYVRPRSWDPQSQIWLLFGGTSTGDGNRYQIDLILNDGGFRVRRDLNGSKVNLDSDPISSYNSSYWYAVTVDWHTGGGFDIYIQRDGYSTILSALSTTDTTFNTTGKIGYRTSGNMRGYFDDIQKVI